eukprot:gene44008-59609_t
MGAARMRILWRDDHPGLFISDLILDEDGAADGRLNIHQWSAFRSATTSCLDRIHSRPVGRDLLGLISRRHQGIGVRAAGSRCQIVMGLGTVANQHGPAAGRTLVRDQRRWPPRERPAATADERPASAAAVRLNNRLR